MNLDAVGYTEVTLSFVDSLRDLDGSRRVFFCYLTVGQ